MANELHWSDQQLGEYGQSLLRAFFLTCGLSQVLLAGLAERFGAKPSLVLVIIGFSCVSMAMGPLGGSRPRQFNVFTAGIVGTLAIVWLGDKLTRRMLDIFAALYAPGGSEINLAATANDAPADPDAPHSALGRLHLSHTTGLVVFHNKHLIFSFYNRRRMGRGSARLFIPQLGAIR
jgi:hypothetical protein